MVALFIVTGLFIFYTYFGYPIILVLLNIFQREKNLPPVSRLPSISLIIPVYNEEGFIEPKLKNTLRLDYPEDKLKIIVASDGSTDRTVPIVRKYLSRGIKLLDFPAHRGKMSAINRTCSRIESDLIVFTDASAIFHRTALRELAAPFADDTVGAVSGALYLREENSPSADLKVDWYWRMEKFIRRRESELYSCVSATGAIYAVRREVFTPWPEDTILDDLLIPLEAVRRGLRIVFADRAVAWEATPTDLKLEFKRKVRTLAGNYQAFSRASWAFMPWRSGIWAVLISHKLFRLLVPFALPVLLLSTGAGPPFLRPLFYLQIVFYILAGLGWLSSRSGTKPVRLFSVPFTFLLLNAAAFQAFVVFFFRKNRIAWK